MSIGDRSKSANDRDLVGFNEEENQIAVNKVRTLNYTMTEKSVDEHNNSGYINKKSLKGRLVQGGRWQEDLDSTNQETNNEELER